MSKRLFLFFTFLMFSLSLYAQRVSYPELVFRAEQPEIFIDELLLPGDDGKTTLAFTFRFNHDFLPFKKIPFDNTLNAPNEAQFYTMIRLNAEIFEGNKDKRRASAMKSVSRDAWTDTVFVSTFEETQTDELYTSGFLSTQLQPGMHNYILQLTLMQERNERSTQRENIYVPNLTAKDDGEIYLIRDVEESGEEVELQLINLDDNVPFGEDFHALIRIPNYNAETDYRFSVDRATISRRDTTSGENVFEQEISTDEIHIQSTLRITQENNPTLILSQGNQDFTYAVVQIPHKTFQNAPYLIKVYEADNEEAVAEKFFRTYWADMPASLYNLNIAIDMLKYIVSEKQLERLKSGSSEEKERKFREFWDSKDPTPETVYNELMAEYYRRIDYAFKEFGSQENPLGHESDQGEVYIKFGPPASKERQFPTDDRVREIWKYNNRTFVFEATTGFGDFKLIGSR